MDSINANDADLDLGIVSEKKIRRLEAELAMFSVFHGKQNNASPTNENGLDASTVPPMPSVHFAEHLLSGNSGASFVDGALCDSSVKSAVSAVTMDTTFPKNLNSSLLKKDENSPQNDPKRDMHNSSKNNRVAPIEIDDIAEETSAQSAQLDSGKNKPPEENGFWSFLHNAKAYVYGEEKQETDEEEFLDPINEDDNNLSSLKVKRGVAVRPSGQLVLNFLHDKPSTMTYSRRMALSLMKKKWYNPLANVDQTQVNLDGSSRTRQNTLASDAHGSRDSEDMEQFEEMSKTPPSLEKSWAYFEHVILPRYIFSPESNLSLLSMFSCRSVKLERSSPGECYQKTKLYSPLLTPLNQMGDFGLGFGLYFTSLYCVGLMMLIATLMNIPNILYYSSKKYSNSQEQVSSLILGSAICTEQHWKLCPTCIQDDFKGYEDRFYEHRVYDGTEKTLIFAKKNECDGATFEQGMINWGTIIFFVFCIFFLNRYSKKMETEFDEDEQTAQDYSISVNNPPPGANDPDEWKQYFEEISGGRVTCATIAVDNDLLVRTLVQRREILQELRLQLPPGSSMDENSLALTAAKKEASRKAIQQIIACVLHPFGVALDIPALYGKLIVLTSKIRGLAQMSYPTTRVFISFETEGAQRQALSKLCVSKWNVFRNNVKSLADPNLLFRGIVLDISEPEEPSDIRWQDLNSTFRDRLKRFALTTFVTCMAVGVIAFLIYTLKDRNTSYAAMTIALANGIFPQFGKIITGIESHTSESTKQASLYLKIGAFRWVNTAIIITLITPFTSTITNGGDHLIYGIFNIFLAEIGTTTLFQIFDPVGNLKKHFLAPRAKTQEKMNLLFKGTETELAERYTNMTKIMFLTFFYCSIYPGALLLSALAFLINYYADRFSLMRTWAPAPRVGTIISRLSRKYFFSVALIALGFSCAYHWAGFPYDNLCEDGTFMNSSVFEEREPLVITIENVEVTVMEGDTTYKFCSQRNFIFSGYQPKEREWMTSDQELLTQIFGWTFAGIFSFVVLRLLFQFLRSVISLFIPSYEPVGNDMGINFSDVDTINAYIPQVSSASFSYPLIACELDDLEERYFSWFDPDKPHAYYCLSRDVEDILAEKEILGGFTQTMRMYVFSRVKNWPVEK